MFLFQAAKSAGRGGRAGGCAGASRVTDEDGYHAPPAVLRAAQLAAPRAVLRAVLIPLILLAAALTVLLLSAWRPGAAGRWLSQLRARSFPLLAVVAALLAAVCLDERARTGLWLFLTEEFAPSFLPVWQWLLGPDLPRDLLAAVPLVALLAADAWLPGWPSAGAVRQVAGAPLRALRRAGASVLPYLPLALGWIDTIASTAGFSTQAGYRALGEAGVPLPGEVWSTPHPEVPELVWWVAASVLARYAGAVSRTRNGRWPSWWAAVPLVGGVLGALARPVAVLAAVPTFAVMAVAYVGLAVAAAWQARAGVGCSGGRTGSAVLPAVLAGVLPALGRVFLLGLLCVSVDVRWYGWPPELVDDATGYHNIARDMHRYAAEKGWNALAVTFLDLHPFGREPFIMVVFRLAFDLMGESSYHQKYVTLAAAIAGVWLTYRFGRATVGAAEGLLAALLLATIAWFVVGSYQGLREEVALLLVYGLGLLVVTTPERPGRGRALVGGLLAGAAVLTRIDTAGSIAFLLGIWALRLGRHRDGRWRVLQLTAAVSGTLVALMCLGFQYRFGDFLAPARSMMGQDIRDLVDPLFRGEVPADEAVRRFWTGTLLIYGHSVFGDTADRIGAVLGPLGWLADPLLLALFGSGVVGLLARRRYESTVAVGLALIAAYVPPYAHNASLGLYPDRYAYQVAPAACCVLSWAVLWVVRALWRAAATVRLRLEPTEARAVSAGQ